jgi:hypothetical protein
MVNTKWPPKQDGRPFENRTFASRFRIVASLDCFIKKRIMNKIFFVAKRFRLAEEKIPVGFSNGKNKMAAI